MLNFNRFLAIALVFLCANSLFSQTPGQIFKAASPAANPLNPNGDVWSTNTNAAHTANEASEFELDWKALPTLIAEPNADLQAGGSCLMTEIVEYDVTGAASAYAYFDDFDGLLDNGNDLIFFRLRCARPWTTGNFGYSVLLDTDMKFGFTGPQADPNAVSGNPGFEIEVRVQTGGANQGVNIDNVDGTINGTNIANLPMSRHYQEVYAFYNDSNCTQAPVFHDIYVPLDSLGLTASSQFRVQPATSQSGQSVLSGSAADFNGVDDNLYNNIDSLMVSYINNQPPVTGTDLGTGMNGFPVEIAFFEARSKGDAVELDWVTASEQNNDYFTVERSTNLQQIEAIAELPGAGNSSDFLHYQHLDRQPLGGRSFYRIRQTDFDGSQSFSKWIAVTREIKGKLELTVAPNPSQGNFSYFVLNAGPTPLKVEIIDLQGRVLQTDTFTDAPAILQKDIQLQSNFSKGLFLLRVSQGISSVTQVLTVY